MMVASVLLPPQQVILGVARLDVLPVNALCGWRSLFVRFPTPVCAWGPWPYSRHDVISPIVGIVVIVVSLASLAGSGTASGFGRVHNFPACAPAFKRAFPPSVPVSISGCLGVRVQGLHHLGPACASAPAQVTLLFMIKDESDKSYEAQYDPTPLTPSPAPQSLSISRPLSPSLRHR